MKFKFVDTNQKVPAIKFVREYTNLGLKEAKDIVDAAVNGIIDIPLSSPIRKRQYNSATECYDWLVVSGDIFLREAAAVGISELSKVEVTYSLKELLEKAVVQAMQENRYSVARQVLTVMENNEI